MALAGLLAVGGITLISQGSVSAATPDERSRPPPIHRPAISTARSSRTNTATPTTRRWSSTSSIRAGRETTWELLVINSTAGSNGTADTVIDHPQAGVDYIGDNGGTINYWIVCKGTTPYTPNPQHSVVVDCGKATLTLSNPEEYGQPGEDYTFTYTVDGVEKQVTVAPGGTETIDELFPEDSGTHTVSIDGVDYTIDTNCEDDATTPAEPNFVDPTCAEPTADVDATDTDEYTYNIVGTVAPGGTVTVTATATAGHVLDGVSELDPHPFPVARRPRLHGRRQPRRLDRDRVRGGDAHLLEPDRRGRRRLHRRRSHVHLHRRRSRSSDHRRPRRHRDGRVDIR